MVYIGPNSAPWNSCHMIERYSITASSKKVHERFSVDVPDSYVPRFNAAPTQLLPVITSSAPQGISTFYWGTLPAWSKNKTPGEKVINVHAESLFEKPALKRALAKNRCVVPADSFYAWKKVGKKITIPYRFTASSDDLFSFAAIWEEFEDEDGHEVHTFMVITAMANEQVKQVHDRMPVILNRENEKAWLDSKSEESKLLALLTVDSGIALTLYPVSPSINAISNDVPSLIMPVPPTDQFGNLTLFD